MRNLYGSACPWRTVKNGLSCSVSLTCYIFRILRGPQNAQNLGFAETTLFHEQLKIEKVKSYYFSLLFTGLLSGEAYKNQVVFTCRPFNTYGFHFDFFKRPVFVLHISKSA